MVKTTSSKLGKELESLKDQVRLLDDKFKRALADYQNQEKRHETQRSLLMKLANETLLDKILPILDDLERAQSHLNDAGLGHVIKQFHQVLVGEGLEIVDSDGADFDPATMDCAEVVAGEKNKVVKTVARGYRLYDKVLRPARVEVGNGVSDRDPAQRDGTNNGVSDRDPAQRDGTNNGVSDRDPAQRDGTNNGAEVSPGTVAGTRDSSQVKPS